MILSNANITQKSMTVLHISSDLESAEKVRICLEYLIPSIRVNLFKHLNEVFNYLNKLTPYQTEKDPDLILLGAKLPFMTGMEFIDTLNRYPSHRQIPVAGITENGNSGSMTTLPNFNIVFTVDQANFEEDFLRIEDLIMDYGSVTRHPRLFH